MTSAGPSSIDIKGKGRALPLGTTTYPDPLEDHHWGPMRESDRWTAANVWKESRKRAKENKESWDYGDFLLWRVTRDADSSLE